MMIVIPKRFAIAKRSAIVVVGLAGGYIKGNATAINLDTSRGEFHKFLELFHRIDFDVSKSFGPSECMIHDQFRVLDGDDHLQMLLGDGNHRFGKLIIVGNDIGQIANIRSEGRISGIFKYFRLLGKFMVVVVFLAWWWSFFFVGSN